MTARSDANAHVQSTRMVSRSFQLWLGAAAIAVMTAVAYFPSMQSGFIWDDDDYIVNRTVVHDANGLDDIWFRPKATPQYYPMVFSTFWLEHKLWGLDATGYHIVNVALHIISALLLFVILRRLGLGDGVAWVAAAIFAVHPVHVESVAWISERKNVLSGVFYLSSLLVAISVFRLGREQTNTELKSKTALKRERRLSARDQSHSLLIPVILYVAMLALFAAALLSKTVTCSLPAVILLLIWWKRAWITQLEILALAPMFGLGLALAMHTIRVEREHVGVEVLELDYSFVERCLIAGRALWFYAGKLIWPHPIIFIYPRWHIRADMWWLYIYPAGVLATIIALWMLRSRIGRGPLVAVLIFCGTLVPALGFIDVFPMVYSFVADHFQYLASISLFVLGVATVAWIIKPLKFAGPALAGIVLLLLCTITWREGFKYEGLIALWTDTVNKNHRAAMAHINLGNEINLANTREAWERALLHYTAAITLDDPAIDSLVLSRAHYGIGRYWLSRNDFPSALKEFQVAIALKPNQPMPHYGAGHTLKLLGRFEEAIAAYSRALDLRPSLQLAIDGRQEAVERLQSSTLPKSN